MRSYGNIGGKKIKKANVQVFGFFLIFSAILWVLVQLSKEYNRNVEIPLTYVNMPLDKSLQDSPKSLKFNLEAKGFLLIWKYQLFKPGLTIDLSNTKEVGSQLVYNIRDNRNTIENQLNIDFDNANFLKDSLVFDFQPRKEKRIVVLPKTDLNYDVGFSAIENVHLQPDSVTVSGPKNIIDTLTSITTKSIKGDNLNKSISGTVAIDTSNLGMLNFYRNTVDYNQKIEKFTEGNVEIPVEVINVPRGTNLTIFPKKVMVYYQVNLKNYEYVKGEQFKVICDFTEIQEGVGYMLAKVSKKPRIVNNVRLNERKIQFIIKR
ncbi:YbbR-like domain-containing protein [Zunongwangia sp. HRR-M8]|uniref:YbbR-like domain-containing protein n=1 Tax=Zunongwangia sp. HRR-M8 TaxID=3015170 RepID=UPI0022DD5A03|nr:YbbR-like domain-containing protein [Zunongwangia sp. HRR-M8]WBL23093.1 YbbR-like domain-containing protein [Zunongwangia sp. HRR-M8]